MIANLPPHPTSPNCLDEPFVCVCVCCLGRLAGTTYGSKRLQQNATVCRRPERVLCNDPEREGGAQGAREAAANGGRWWRCQCDSRGEVWVVKLLYGWPEPCVQSVCMVCMAGTSPSVQSKTVCMYTVLYIQCMYGM
jgi:hypothetical protein